MSCDGPTVQHSHHRPSPVVVPGCRSTPHFLDQSKNLKHSLGILTSDKPSRMSPRKSLLVVSRPLDLQISLTMVDDSVHHVLTSFVNTTDDSDQTEFLKKNNLQAMIRVSHQEAGLKRRRSNDGTRSINTPRRAICDAIQFLISNFKPNWVVKDA
jgi:hypothetical protein